MSYDINNSLPSSEPWVFIDKIISVEDGKQLLASKCFKKDDPFVVNHFKHGPLIVPGVLLIESAAQAAYLLGRLSKVIQPDAKMIPVLARCQATFIAPVYAEQDFTIYVKLEDSVNSINLYTAIISVNAIEVCKVKLFSSKINLPNDEG